MFTHSDIITALSGTPAHAIGAPAAPYPGAMVDSRRVRPGALYVAFPGEHVDGNDYFADAFAHGAAGALMDRMPAGIPAGKAVYVVPGALVALQELAKWFW